MKKKQQILAEIFASPTEGNGLLGDVAFTPDLEALLGQYVTAKRFAWDDGWEAGNNPDITPYSEMGYASPDLAGILTNFRFTVPNGQKDVGWEVGGQPADPATVRAAEPPADAKTVSPSKPPAKKTKSVGKRAVSKAVRPAKSPRKKTK